VESTGRFLSFAPACINLRMFAQGWRRLWITAEGAVAHWHDRRGDERKVGG